MSAFVLPAKNNSSDLFIGVPNTLGSTNVINVTLFNQIFILIF